MQKFSVACRVFLTIFILLLNACAGNDTRSGNPDVEVNELVNSTTSYDETVHINNCGGRADSDQTKSRSFSTNIEGGINVGVKQIVEGVISAKYSQARNVSVSHKLVAPAGTNMEFVLSWKEEVHAGNVLINGETRTYTVNIPIAVEQVSSQDLGCSYTQNNVPTEIPTSVLSVPSTPALLEVIAVPTDGNVVKSQIALVRGAYYTLRVSGTFVIGLDGHGDAEYAFSSSNDNVLNNCENDLTNVDVGLAIQVFGNTKLPSWGEFNPSHVYEYSLVGNGVPLGLQYNDCYWADNKGHLTVEIWQVRVGN